MGLAVDHGDATGPDREIIEVGPAVAGDLSVMQQLDRMSSQMLLGAQRRVAHRWLRDQPGGLRLLDHGSQHRADQVECLRDVTMAALAPPYVFASRAGASLALRTVAQARQTIASETGAIAA